MDINQNLRDMKKRIEVINRFNKLLKLIDEAVELMRKFHPHGERLYWVLYYSYMSAYRAKNVKEIIDKLGSHFLRITWIHRATYFRWQDQAFEAVGGILWGYEEESRKIMEYFKKNYEIYGKGFKRPCGDCEERNEWRCEYHRGKQRWCLCKEKLQYGQRFYLWVWCSCISYSLTFSYK